MYLLLIGVYVFHENFRLYENHILYFLYADKNFFSEININTIKEKKETSKKQLFYDIIIFSRREDSISNAMVVSGILEEK